MFKQIFLFAASLVCATTFSMESSRQELIKSIIHVCKARNAAMNGFCHAEFTEYGLLKRHLREAHGIAPKNAERHSCVRDHSPSVFK